MDIEFNQIVIPQSETIELSILIASHVNTLQRQIHLILHADTREL